MNWITGNGKETNFYDITQKIKSHNSRKGQVIVGTDSHVRKNQCTFTTTIVLLGAENQKGGLYFYKKEKYDGHNRIINRILKEVEKSVNLAVKITELCPTTNMEIHIDVSPEGQGEKTSSMARMLMGYARGSGFKCKIKPDSFAASTVADKHTK